MRQLPLPVASVVLALLAFPAIASEYCVVCSGPHASYRCMTDDGRSGAGADQGVWLRCISEIARGGGHETCSIDREAAAPCAGEVRNIATTPYADTPGSPAPTPSLRPLAPAPDVQPAPSANINPAAKSLPAPKDNAGTAPLPPPGTHPSSAADAQPVPQPPPASENEGTGSAIGNAAKKTWDCMSSLFKKC